MSANKAIEEYNASNARVLTKLLSGGTDDMLDLMAAHLPASKHKQHTSATQKSSNRLTS